MDRAAMLVMRCSAVCLLLLPVVTGFPGRVGCANDTDTELFMDGKHKIMGEIVAPGTTPPTVERHGRTTTSYVPGEILQVRASGYVQEFQGVFRASDSGNVTFHSIDDVMSLRCRSQIYAARSLDKREAVTVYFRVGCNVTEAVKLTFVFSMGYGSPVNLTDVVITAAPGKHDPSCSGGPMPQWPTEPWPAPVGPTPSPGSGLEFGGVPLLWIVLGAVAAVLAIASGIVIILLRQRRRLAVDLGSSGVSLNPA